MPIPQAVQKCAGDDGEPDLKKATLLLEVYSVELQMCAAQRNYKRLKVCPGFALRRDSGGQCEMTASAHMLL